LPPLVQKGRAASLAEPADPFPSASGSRPAGAYRCPHIAIASCRGVEVVWMVPSKPENRWTRLSQGRSESSLASPRLERIYRNLTVLKQTHVRKLLTGDHSSLLHEM